MVRQKCDPHRLKEFDCSRLSADFAKLAKPAQRALMNAGVLSARNLARRRAEEIAGLHGIGLSAMPLLRAALKKRRLKFKAYNLWPLIFRSLFALYSPAFDSVIIRKSRHD
jgi:hypothetical protein